MSDSKHYTTASKDRIPLSHKLIYGLGAFVNNLLAAAVGSMMIVLNIGLGMNPALVGLLGSLPRITDAITDPIMGYISDNTKSKWGRRRPYIFVGAILAGLLFILLWQLPLGKSDNYYFWYFLFISMLFYLGYTIFATPWVALGYELTPDYNERTRLMGVQNAMGQLAYVVSPWFLSIMQATMFKDMIDGAANLAIGIGIFTIAIGILPAIFLHEHFVNIKKADSEKKHVSVFKTIKKNIIEFFEGFLAALKVSAFLKLCLATFLVFNGFILISSFQSYVIIYYVFGGDTKLGAEYVGWSGMAGSIATFAVIAITTWMATKIGKRKTFFITMSISIVGYLLKWFCYNPDFPWLIILPTPLMAFGLGALFTLMSSMVADVVDLDELNTKERREGMFGSIFWWVVKLGMAAAIAGGGLLLNLTGFDEALGGAQSAHTLLWLRLFDIFVPVFFTLIAIWSIKTFPIDEKMAHEIRQKLEKRRGTVHAE